jgi:hypothetical protein
MKEFGLFLICVGTVLVVGLLAGSLAYVAVDNPRAAGFVLGVLSAVLVALIVVVTLAFFDRRARF